MMIRRSRRTASFAVLSAVASLVVWGCGSSGSGSTAASATHPLTKAQYVKAAEKICKKGLEEKDEVLREAVEESASTKIYRGAELRRKREELAEGMLPHYEQIATGLSELSPPPDRKRVEDMIAKLEAEIAKGKKSPVALLGTDPFAEADAAARAYGLVRCGSI